MGYEATIDQSPLLITNSSSDNAVFVINNSSSYIIKTVSPAQAWVTSNDTTSINAVKTLTGSNQLKGQKDIVELYGSFTSTKFSLKVNDSPAVTITSSNSIALPI